jgi:hypothetical protein
MSKRKPTRKYVHEFIDMSIIYAGSEWLISGSATYSIENCGIGQYEYWGSQESNNEYIAEFDTAYIMSYRFVRPVDDTVKTLYEQDEENIKDLVIEELNKDIPLCIELANLKTE